MPALPCSQTWNPENQDVYVAGDLSFIDFVSNGAFPISNHRLNRFTPELVLGRGLTANDGNANPIFSTETSWVMEAQYDWMDAAGTFYAQAGPKIAVTPGEEITSHIAYDPVTGAITVGIQAAEGTSSITVARPFPSDAAVPFATWREYFQQAATASPFGLRGLASANFQTNFVDEATLCPLLPWQVNAIALNGALLDGDYQSRPGGGLTCGGGTPVQIPDGLSATCTNLGYTPSSDPGYRAVVRPSAGAETVFPSATTDWTLGYRYQVPPLPCSSTWNPDREALYLWGDVDFDVFGSQGAHPLSGYKYNQLVPQLVLGNGLTGNTPGTYAPAWESRRTWVIQAQYFWESDSGTPYAQTGPLVQVNPGDAVDTTIAYVASTGAITLTISAPEGASTVVVPRPFPNASPAPFASWKAFFQAAAAASSQGILGQAALNVESSNVDASTLCQLLPWQVTQISIPGVPGQASSFTVTPYNGLSCGGSLVALGF